MNNITDYVRWYKDIGFDAKPFSRVDNIVLCQLSYIDFKQILGEDYTAGVNEFGEDTVLTLSECITKFKQAGIPIRKQAPDDSERFQSLVRACVASKRFGNLKITRFVDEYSGDSSIQYCTTTFTGVDEEDASYVAFRGTDSTIAGWKEDFMFCFTLTGAQTMAAEHLKAEIDRCGRVLTGGHSKGGNLAMYSAAELDPERFGKVIRVFTNDGPGFCEDILSEDMIKRIDPITTRIIPVFSIVGCQFEPHITDTTIVQSDAVMLDQHELCSWGVAHGGLAVATERDPLSVRIDDGINNWIRSVDLEDRQRFVDALFDSMSEGGTKTIQEFSDLGIIGWERVFRNVIQDDTAIRETIASLPDQMLFDGNGKKITRWTIYKQFMSSELAKGLATVIIGILMCIIPEGFIFYAVGAALILITAFFTCATVRRLIKDNWNLNKHIVYALLTIFLTAVTLITFIKEGALFVMASAIFGTGLLAESYNCVNRAKKDDWKFRRAFLIIMAGLWGGCGLFILFAPQNTLGFYSFVVGTVAAIDGTVRSLLSFHKKNRGSSKAK
ncbi:MAG: DUF2974 domain-containing protein [Clostridiales bacterium]|nr:DUF2974 domain-containing protein [Clostridiales bacterium]